jgi:hypothetical protein
MKLTKSFVAVTSALALAATPLLAGTGKTFKETVVVEEEPTPWYSASLSTGYDSLYMFRGVNVLRNSGGYGNGLWSTTASFTWNISENDFLTVGGWMAFGLGNAGGYRELNVPVNYVHTFGDLSVGLGYTFYYTFPQGSQFFANEVNASAAYNFDLGFMSLTPSVTYFFNFGPDSDTGYGSVPVASSYLDLRVAGSIPVIGDAVSIDPWVAFGLNFDYNTESTELTPFSGANNLEFGIAIPWAINDVITLSAYGAYSIAFEDLGGVTQPNTIWGGGKVTFAF